MSARRASNPLWARSPGVLRRYPALLVAVVAGSLLLAVAAASSPLFLSSAGSSALRQEVEDATVFGAGLTLKQRDYLGDRVLPEGIRPALELPTHEERDAAIRQASAEIPGLGPRVLTLLGAEVAASQSGRPARVETVRLLHRTDALSHVTKLAGGGEGVWLSDNRAGQLGVRPGDSLTLAYESDGTPRVSRKTTVTVAGIYRALWSEPSTPFWRILYEQIYPPSDDAPPPPAFLLMNEETYQEVSAELRSYANDIQWEFPLADPSPTLEQAKELDRELGALQASLQARSTEAARTLRCGDLRCATSTLLPTVIREAEEEVSALRGPADLLATAGTLVALAVVAAAGAFLVARRRNEALLLHARGMSPLLFAGKAALETVLPVLAGTALGFLVAVGVISLVGPGAAVDPAAILDAAQVAALRVPAALAVLALVAGLMFLGLSGRTRERAGLLRFVPWEVALLLGAAFCFQRLSSGHALVEEAGGVERPSAYVLLFPIFFVAGFAGLVARLWGPLLRGLRERSGRLSAGPYLAVHRLAGAERLAVLLVAACALCPRDLRLRADGRALAGALGHREVGALRREQRQRHDQQRPGAAKGLSVSDHEGDASRAGRRVDRGGQSGRPDCCRSRDSRGGRVLGRELV